MSENDLPPKVERKQRAGWITQERKYRLITPLFGGGVEPGKADPVTTIRGTEIRGHLRFWWRATRGGDYTSVAEMKQAEGHLWGSAKTASKINLTLSEIEEGTSISHQNLEVRYVTFPLDDPENTSKLKQNVGFSLKITFPISERQAVESALWAWQTFGGLGARTRRGFGALHCLQVKENDEEIIQPAYNCANSATEIMEDIKKHVSEGNFPDNVPHLSRNPTNYKVTASPTTAHNAWKNLVEKLKKFRQDRNPGAKNNVPGRSKWAEPDAIRHLTDQTHPKHSVRLTSVDEFPRSQFGLPIEFKFKDEGTHSKTDPQKTTLVGVNHERLASPLILRPIICEGEKAVGLSTILEAPRQPEGGLMLRYAPDRPVPSATGLSQGSVDILQAFLATL